MEVEISEWRARASQQFGKMTITPHVEDFKVQIEHNSVGDIHLFDMKTPPHQVIRDANSIRDTDPKTYKLSLQIEGFTVLNQFGRECVLSPGSLAIYHSRVPYSLDYPQPQRSMVMQFPADLVQLPPSAVEQITAQAISREDRLGTVAIPLFEQLALNMKVFSGPHAGSLLHSSIDMLVAVFAEELSAHSQPSSELAVRATQYIDENLADPDLGPTTVADALFVSVRHLHSQFALTGQSVGSYIKHARMERIRRDLANPLKSSDSIREIGELYGILSPAHLSRAFKGIYGETPREYRKRILEA
ncbi:MAG: helix-turn-helix domain-containing protein [Gleimia sp.]|jgi:AraC-like DNA-binding protein|nr:helix-turn-helix domain-containing protein [Acidobacteriota bacterium]